MTTTTLPGPGVRDAQPGAAPERAQGLAVITTAGALAAVTSAAGGLVHAAAAGSHNGERTLAVLFAVAAVVQLGCGWLVVMRWSRPALAVTAAANTGAFAAWLFTRNAGIPFVAGLEEAQRIALADASAAAFEALAVGGAAMAMLTFTRPGAARRGAVAALGAVALFGAVPAMAAPHDHSDHADPPDHAHRPDATGLDAGGHPHTAASAATAGTAATADVPAPAGNTFLGIELPPVEGVTDDQKLAAARLIRDTRAAVSRYREPSAAEAAGFVSIGDGITGFEHFVNWNSVVNENTLDPDEPESLVFEVGRDGSRTLASAMYILPPGRTMADVPDIAGPLTAWHDHQNLCWDSSGTRLAGIVVNGRCRPGGSFRATPPMLHVWVTDHPCGPFAGIEAGGHTGACHEHGG